MSSVCFSLGYRLSVYSVCDLQNFGFMVFESPDTVDRVLSERVSGIIIQQFCLNSQLICHMLPGPTQLSIPNCICSLQLYNVHVR